jgi:hypothetical protein
MQFSVVLFLPAILTIVNTIPIGNLTVTEQDAAPGAGIIVDKEAVSKEVPTAVVESSSETTNPDIEGINSSGETTTLQPLGSSGERIGRQLDEEDDEEGNTNDDDDDDDDEDEDDGEEEEEEERKLPAPKAGIKSSSKKKASTGKPVPVLVEGVEDDEAEDLGIFEREEPKSIEKSDEEKSEEDQHDEDDDESAEEERNDRPAGLVADPSSGERGDVFDAPTSQLVQNEANESEGPLAVAVVQREEEIRDPAAPVNVEGTSISSQTSQIGEKVDKTRKNKPKKEAEEDDEDDDEDDEDEEEEAARSEKVSQARAAYPSPVLYYYPFPENA